MNIAHRFRGFVTAALVLIVVSTATAQYSGGAGEPNDPYQIATAADLIALGETPEDYDKHFILTADIDLDPNLPGGRVFDKAVIAPATDSDRKRFFEGTPFAGVFDGKDHTISRLTITGRDYLGLFGGLGCTGTVSNLGLEAVRVSGIADRVGGLVGQNDGSITSSHSSGSVNGRMDVGGLVGLNHGSIAVSYSVSQVAGMSSHAGGLVGYNNGCITASRSSGMVRGNWSVGGLAGRSVSCVNACYSTGSVTGIGKQVGGLVGYNGQGTVTMSYSSGLVSGTGHVGGLVGLNVGDNVTASFWDAQTSGQTTSAAGVGLTTAEMQSVETFLDAAWDFIDEVRNGTNDYWQIAPGEYPRLRYHAGDRPAMPEGLGTVEQPYLIRDARDLGTVWFEPLAHYRLGQPIDLSGITWSMAVIPWFGGSFDGNGCVVRDLRVRGSGYLGLFGVLGRTATVSGLGLEAVEITGIGDYVGGLSGVNYANIRSSYSAGSVSGIRFVGGLAGCCNLGSIVASYSSASVDGTEFAVGGLVGWNISSIDASHSTGPVTGEQAVGGLVGWNWREITMSYSAGPVSGDRNVGGLVGGNSGSIQNCSGRGPVTGTGLWIGGLVGHNGSAAIINCYSVGSVSGIEWWVGGIVGYNGGGAITGSFWDSQTSGWGRSAGGIGKTTAEMQDASIFLEAGWDFTGETANGTEDTWWIDEGKDYPRLWWEPRPPVRLPVIELDAAGFDAGIAEGVVLVDFFATWCSHCTTQAPILEEVADRLEGRAQVAKLDVDRAQSIVQRYGVTAIPTLILFRMGTEVKRFVGVTSADVLVAAILAAVDLSE